MVSNVSVVSIDQKYAQLQEILKSYGSVAVAFSSGVDSTFLLKVAHDVLGDRAIAVTATSCSFPKRELKEAEAYTAANGIKHVVVESEELSIEGFSNNPPNRCYLCKTELFTKIRAIAEENGITEVAEGSNMDDNGDYRPGLIAVRENGIRSPLRQANLNKAEIRLLSRRLGLPTWDKQSFACLSSRFPYGEEINREKLDRIDKAEQFLLNKGFRQLRVRNHGDMARIEVSAEQWGNWNDAQLRQEVQAYFRELGYIYVSVDLGGYQMGSMNKTLPKEER